jgi:large subunit ribosomal protein L10
MVRPDKAAAVAELTDEFRSSQGAVLTEYRGLTVKQLQELRRALGENATYAVVKNTLTKIAAKEAGVEGFDDLLTGPSAIAFIKGDPVATAKSLRDFARTNSPLVIKGGILDGKLLTIGEIAKIADLESREVLLAKLAGALVASLQNAVSLFNAPLAQVARLAGALQANREQEEGPVVAEATAEAPAAEAAPAEAAPAAETPAEETPAEAAPDDETPAEAAAVEEAAVEEAPAAEAVADETPVADAPDAESVATAPEETPEA